MITEEQLYTVCNGKIAHTKVNLYVPLLNKYMNVYFINNKNRVCAFIANLLVESGRLYYTKELASGYAYEGRKDLGNINKGDGVKYKGRGLIQCTGRSNYQQLTNDFKVDFINHPELLETPEYATKSACWFWFKHNLNSVADTGDFKKTVKVINGGYNALDERTWYYNQLQKIIEIV